MILRYARIILEKNYGTKGLSNGMKIDTDGRNKSEVETLNTGYIDITIALLIFLLDVIHFTLIVQRQTLLSCW